MVRLPFSEAVPGPCPPPVKCRKGMGPVGFSSSGVFGVSETTQVRVDLLRREPPALRLDGHFP